MIEHIRGLLKELKKKLQHKIRKHKNYNNECHNVLNKNVPISKCNILPLSVNLLKATNKT